MPAGCALPRIENISNTSNTFSNQFYYLFDIFNTFCNLQRRAQHDSSGSSNTLVPLTHSNKMQGGLLCVYRVLICIAPEA